MRSGLLNKSLRIVRILVTAISLLQCLEMRAWGMENGPGGSPSGTELVAVIHLHTSLADGGASPLELASAARAAGVGALLITDHFLRQVTYAPWPIGNVLGLTVSRPSVLTAGLEPYFQTLGRAEKDVPSVLILPGLEVSPYARWSGSLLKGSLALQGWQRHVLVFGIEDRIALDALPVAGNSKGGEYDLWSLLYLVPVAILSWSCVRLSKPQSRRDPQRPSRSGLRPGPLGEFVIGTVCVAVLAAGFPFRVERFSIVGKDPGVAPFRYLEETVRRLGGVTAWAHPEAGSEKKRFGIRMSTSPYPEMVARTDADAFAALPAGTRHLLPPGGIWDQALLAHLEGRRASAPFAIAEIDEHSPVSEIDLHALQTVLWVRERSHAGVVAALRAGRMYARFTPEGLPPLRLTSWEIRGQALPAVTSGDSLRADGPVSLRFALSGGNGSPVSIRLVRGGTVIWSARATAPYEKTLQDVPQPPSFYRLDVEGTYPYRLVSNPIFVIPVAGGGEGA